MGGDEFAPSDALHGYAEAVASWTGELVAALAQMIWLIRKSPKVRCLLSLLCRVRFCLEGALLCERSATQGCVGIRIVEAQPSECSIDIPLSIAAKIDE